MDRAIHKVDCKLPQPAGDGDRDMYKYVPYELIDSTFCLDNHNLREGTPCWVLLSKGKNKVPQLYQPARVVSSASASEDDRILVQYQKGSTYRVRRSHLKPVLEDASNVILVAAETNDYRRTAIIHTRPEDHFIEIGCDFGILVDSVVAASSLGVDKSEESITIARERYPSRSFLLGDVFEDDLEIPLKEKQPLVVAIDINGNRELPAVLKCIELVLPWHPHLIIVKSRALHAKLTEDGRNSTKIG